MVGKWAVLMALAGLLLAGCRDSPQSALPATVAGVRPDAAVRFPAGNGDVSGAVFGRPGSNAIVLIAEAGRAPDIWGELPRDLASAGYQVLAVDRSSGASAASVISGAMSYLRGRGAERVVLVGEGLAGAVAVAAIGDAHGVAALSPPITGQDGGQSIDVLAAAAKLTRPLLVVSSLGDVEGAVSARRIYDAAPEPRTLAGAPGMARGAALLQGDAGTEARRVLLDFLRQAFTPLSA